MSSSADSNRGRSAILGGATSAARPHSQVSGADAAYFAERWDFIVRSRVRLVALTRSTIVVLSLAAGYAVWLDNMAVPPYEEPLLPLLPVDAAQLLWRSAAIGALSMAFIETLKRLTPWRAGIQRSLTLRWLDTAPAIDEQERVTTARGVSSIFGLDSNKLVGQLSQMRPSSRNARRDDSDYTFALDRLAIALSSIWRYSVSSTSWAVSWVIALVLYASDPQPGSWLLYLLGAILGSVTSWFLRDAFAAVEAARK